MVTAVERTLKLPKESLSNNRKMLVEALNLKKISQKCLDVSIVSWSDIFRDSFYIQLWVEDTDVMAHGSVMGVPVLI